MNRKETIGKNLNSNKTQTKETSISLPKLDEKQLKLAVGGEIRPSDNNDDCCACDGTCYEDP